MSHDPSHPDTATRERALFLDAAQRGAVYLETIRERPVAPAPETVDRLRQLGGPLPMGGSDAGEVLALLDEIGSPGTVANSGGRYFGFVNGGSFPVARAANVLAAAWDQNAALRVMSPTGAVLEDIALAWLLEMLGLPASSGGAFVTGATGANFICLAAARHAVLAKAGWDVEAKGLFGAQPITVVVGEEVHVSALKALAMLGLGRERVITVPADGQGRMRADLLPRLDDRTIVCAQAGNVNTGAFDPFEAICAAATKVGSWVHVDGAFGLWAAASPELAVQLRGIENASSWATDAHKWLNVPYDSGLGFVRDSEPLRRSMRLQAAAYLTPGADREPSHWTPEGSRRPRGVEVWAVIRSLGRDGIVEMIHRTCRHAARLAEGLRDAGYEVLNDVKLNQVLVSFGTDEQTRSTITEIQRDGTCWCGGTFWKGRAAMRISVSSWATTDDDMQRTLGAIVTLARKIATD